MDQDKGIVGVVRGAMEEAITGLLKPRAYQQEMFEESLRQNIIAVVRRHLCGKLRRIHFVDLGVSF
jgi:hypothetical protein